MSWRGRATLLMEERLGCGEGAEHGVAPGMCAGCSSKERGGRDRGQGARAPLSGLPPPPYPAMGAPGPLPADGGLSAHRPRGSQAGLLCLLLGPRHQPRQVLPAPCLSLLICKPGTVAPTSGRDDELIAPRSPAGSEKELLKRLRLEQVWPLSATVLPSCLEPPVWEGGLRCQPSCGV